MASSDNASRPVLTSNTSLITQDTYPADPEPESLLSRLSDFEYRPAATRPRIVSSIDSLLSFVHYILLFPKHVFNHFYDEETIMGMLLGDRQSTSIGQGFSFTVQSETNYQLPSDLRDKVSSRTKAKPSAVAVKIPRIKRSEIVHFGASLEEAHCLRAIAWECHVLSHPPIRKCKNVVDIYGISWRPVFAGKDGKRRLLPAVILELASEGALSDLFQPEVYCLPYALKWKLVLGIANGLEVLHNHGIIHGDVKAENVLLSMDENGELVPKLADFACSVHDFGPRTAEKLLGKSPPWDAPEVRHGPIALSKIYKTDIYSFGLLVWRLVLEGQTPFDDSQISQTFAGFEDITMAKTRTERLQAIERSKDKDDDELLARIKTTLSGKDLDEPQLEKFFNLTIRHEEAHRVDTIKNFRSHFESVALKSNNKSPLEQTPLQAAKTVSKNMEERVIEEDYDISDHLINNVSQNRAFVASGALKPYIPIILERAATNPIPNEVKMQILEDCLLGATADSMVNVALCYLTGFGCARNCKLGLDWMLKAAERGSLRARAVVGRLYQACGLKMPLDVPEIDWLAEAVTAGSLIASTDLLFLDPLRHASAIEEYRRSWNGLLSPHPINRRLAEDLTTNLAVHDESKFKEIVERFISAEGPQARTVDDVEHKGWRLLHFAATFGHIRMLTWLLDMGARINQRNFLGETALLSACRSGRSKAAATLLDRGANASIPDKIGSTPMHYLMWMDSHDAKDIANGLLANGADLQAKSIPFSVSRWTPQFIGEPDRYSDTPLHWAVAANRLDIVNILLDLGASSLDLSDVDKIITPLDLGTMFTSDPASTSSDNSTSAFNEAVGAAQVKVLKTFLQHESLRDNPLLADARPISVLTAIPINLMCMHGSHYKENLIGTFTLLEPNRTPIEKLGNAIYSDSEILAQEVVDQGCDVNCIITSAGLTPLQLSCMKQSGEMTLFLLRNGADPGLRSPKCSASCMTLFALRPLGTYAREIVAGLIKAGTTYETEPRSFSLLYRRSVKEGWIDIASDVLAYGGDKEVMEQRLLLEILSQNSEASIGPLMFLLEPQHEYGPASPMTDSQSTVFHRLAMIPEDIREDELNQRIVQYLISKFPQTQLLDRTNGAGQTALAVAVSKGNHLFIAEMLQAGADPAHGNITATMMIVDRMHSPAAVSGGFKGLPRRLRQARRFESNSLHMLVLLLDHALTRSAPSVPHDRVAQAAELVTRWRDAEHRDAAITEALQTHLGPRVTAYPWNDRLYIRDVVTLETRRADVPETKIAVLHLWRGMVRDWQKVTS